MTDNIKMDIINNVLYTMSNYIDQTALDILEHTLKGQFESVDINRVSTLPVEKKMDIDEENKYYINLMIIKKKNLCEKTKKRYIDAINRLTTVINKPLNEMNEIDIDIYLQWYEHRNEKEVGGKKNQAVTCNNERRYLSAFFNWMCKESFMTHNPVSNTEPYKEVKQPIDYLKPSQIEALREGCKSLRDMALLEVLRSTGGRIGEIVNINHKDIDWSTGDILILSEKSNKYRTLYLDEISRYHLKKYLDSRTDDNEALFVAENKPYNRLKENTIEYILKHIAERAGVDYRVYPHKLRKTLGMNLRNAGVGLGDIQEILGHAQPDTTARYYAESTPESLRSVRQKLEKLA